MASEVNFPRGGTVKISSKAVFDESGDLDILKEKRFDKKSRPAKSTVRTGKAKTFTKTGKITSSKPIRAKTNKVENKDVEPKPAASIFVPERLSTKKIAKGLLMLGAVKEIRDYELRFNLPNNQTGLASITEMADAYTSLLKRFAQSTDSEAPLDEELHSLDELFNVGQILPCMCLSPPSEDNHLVKVSINPKHFNEQISVKALKTNTVLYGAVAGLEDHGVVVDLGLGGISAFMKTSTRPEGFKIGELRRFRITESDMITLMSGDTRTINVTCCNSDTKEVALKGDNVIFRNLVPGLLLEASVEKRTKEGLTCKFGPLKGYVHVTHLPKHQKEYEPYQQLKVRVLAVNPATKYLYLTCLPSLLNTLDDVPSGSIEIPLAEQVAPSIARIVDKYAFLTMPDGGQTYLGISLLPADYEVSTKLNQTKLKCFWLGWDYLEQKAVLSTKKPNLKKSILPTLKCGEQVVVKVMRIGPTGAKVRLENGLHAFIQLIHLTEVPLNHPEKKIKEGQSLTCKILSVDLVKKRVRLTAKPSIMRSDLSIIDSYDSAVSGSLVQGVIVKLTTGALISFYNDVSGFVPKSQLGKDPVQHPSERFYIGQSVKCRVLSCHPAERKLTLTFILDGSEHDISVEPAHKRLRLQSAQPGGTALNSAPLDTGQTLAVCSILGISAKGFKVISGQGHRANLPKSELSDYPLASASFLSCCANKDTLTDLVCVTSQGKSLIVSNKHMYKYFSSRHGLAGSWDTVQVGHVYPATVMSLTENGVFINFGNGLIGLAPPKLLPQQHAVPGQPPSLQLGQGVLAKVVSCDSNLRRIIVSLREVDCPVSTEDHLLVYQMLSQFVKDMEQCRQLALSHPDTAIAPSRVSKYCVGDIVLANITKRDEHCIEVLIGQDVVGVASHDLMSGCKGQVGDMVSALVVAVHMVIGQLEVLLDPEHVSARKAHSTEDRFSKVKQGQLIKSELLYIGDIYSLVMLKGHAIGKLGYIPTQSHPNSVNGKAGLLYGQVNKVVVKYRPTDDSPIICSFESELEMNTRKAELIQHQMKLPSVGTKVKAVITSIDDLQLNLAIDKAVGRVFINELMESPAPGSSPLAGFKIGQALDVVVMNIKLIKRPFKLRAALKDSPHKALLECSLRQTRLGNLGMSGTEKLKVGVKTNVFVEKLDLASKNKQLHVVSSEGVHGRIIWFDLKSSASSLDDLRLGYPVGTCLAVSVKSISADGTVYFQVSECMQHSPVASGFVPGIIVSFSPATGLTVNVPFSCEAKIPLSEMSEPGVDVDLERFQPGLVVECKVVKKSRHGCLLTLRKESGLLALDEVHQGDILPGVVSHVGPKLVSVVAAGRQGHLVLEDQTYADFANSNRIGSACWVKVLERKGNKFTFTKCSKEEILACGKRSNPQLLKVGEKVKKNDQAKQLPDTAGTVVNETKRCTKSVDQHNADDHIGSCQKSMDTVSNVTTDPVTGVQIVFSNKRVNEPKRALDFAASVQSLHPNLPEAEPHSGKKRKRTGDNTKSLFAQESQGNVVNGSNLSVTCGLAAPFIQVAHPNKTVSEAEYLALIAKQPNSSSLWTKLIAFCSEHGGVEHARSRAEQALNTISYRLETEKLNVWAAYLKLELEMGTADSVDQVLRRALAHMPDIKVYQELIKLYCAAQRPDDAEQSHMLLVRKHCEQVLLWVDFASFYFMHGRLDSARNLLQRCLKNLPNKFHVDAISKFALLEARYGSAERASTMFESILTNFPKRTDIWLIYVDMLIKAEQHESARSVLRRVVMQKLNAKNRNLFYKKLMDFETQHGNAQTLEEAQKMASIM